MDKYFFSAVNSALDKDWDGVISDLNQALLLNHDGPRAEASLYAMRGEAWREKADYEKAIADYLKAIRVDPSKASLYTALARVRIDAADTDDALEDCERSIELDPEDATSYQIRGEVRMARKEYELAIADFTRSLELSSEQKFPQAALKLRAQAYHAIGKDILADANDTKFAESLKK